MRSRDRTPPAACSRCSGTGTGRSPRSADPAPAVPACPPAARQRQPLPHLTAQGTRGHAELLSRSLVRLPGGELAGRCPGPHSRGLRRKPAAGHLASLSALPQRSQSQVLSHPPLPAILPPVLVAPLLGSGQGAQRLLERAHGGQHGGRLVAAVRHAVGAPRVTAAPVR